MLSNYYIYSGFVMGTALVALGIFMMIKPPADNIVSDKQIYFFGITAIVYGAFRFWRSVVAYKRKDEQPGVYRRQNPDIDSSND